MARVDGEPFDAGSLVALRVGMVDLEPRHTRLRVAKRSPVVARPDDRRLRHPSLERADDHTIEEHRSSCEVLAELSSGVDLGCSGNVAPEPLVGFGVAVRGGSPVEREAEEHDLFRGDGRGPGLHGTHIVRSAVAFGAWLIPCSRPSRSGSSGRRSTRSCSASTTSTRIPRATSAWVPPRRSPAATSAWTSPGIDGWRMYHGSDGARASRSTRTAASRPSRSCAEGCIDHSDSLGATARFGRGDVQWLTAGKGIVHCEMFPLLDRDGDRTRASCSRSG